MSSLTPHKPSPEEVRHWAKRYRTQLAASSATVVSTLLAFPLESVKTRIQSYPNGFVDCVRGVWKTEGSRGFWRGVFAPLMSITIVRTFSFSVYQSAKYKTSAFIGQMTGGEEPLAAVNRPGSMPNLSTMACFALSGAAAGSLCTFVSCPFELTKNAMVISKQLANSTATSLNDPIRNSYQGKGTLRTARQIVRNCGLGGLYSGFRLQFMRETFGTGMYFMAYESGKQLLVSYQGVNSPTSPGAVVVAGACCGIIALATTYPLDRAKTAYQRACLEQGKLGKMKVPPIEYFKKASYQGMTVAASRSALTNALLFSTFEYAKKRINNLDNPIEDRRSSIK